MIIHKAYKFRVYPNKEQKELIHKTFCCNRFLYNYYLEDKKKEYNQTKKIKISLSVYECIKDIPSLYSERPYLKEVDFMSLRCTMFDLEDAFLGLYKEVRNYPKFKSKYSRNSYRTNMITSTYKDKTYHNIKLDLKNKTITLPKLKDLKIRGYRNTLEIEGRIINETLSKEKTGKYYVSALYEQEIPSSIWKPSSIVGI